MTKREEPLPVAVSVIGAPGMTSKSECIYYELTVYAIGTDLILVDLVEKGMKAGGLPTEVKTGRSMY